jgi:hypothetical protein
MTEKTDPAHRDAMEPRRTPTTALTRADLPCPEVQALVGAAKRARQQIVDYGGDGYASGLDTALAAFGKGE